MPTRLTSRFDALRSLANSRKMKNREYRRAMIDGEIRHGLTDQIRAMRQRLGLSQSELARRMGTSQPAVARIEASRDKYVSFPTLLSVANAFDVALLVRFVPFSELVRRSFDGSEFEQAPLSFDEEVTLVSQERVPVPAASDAFFPSPAVTSVTVTSHVNQVPVPTDEFYRPVA